MCRSTKNRSTRSSKECCVRGSPGVPRRPRGPRLRVPRDGDLRRARAVRGAEAARRRRRVIVLSSSRPTVCSPFTASCARTRSHAEPAPAGLVELLGLEAVRPGALVVLLREVAGAVAVEEGLADAGGVLLVARAPGRGGDVHDVAPALLIGD